MQAQQYITYADRPGGRLHWLPIGSTDTEILDAKRQLRSAGKFRIRLLVGRAQGPVRMRRRCY
jgi:hypothetical protein